MTRKRFPRTSPSMVVACTALAVALTGVGYAAVVLPANSVGARQLKKNAVRSSKVKDRSLLRRDFARNQLPRGAQGPQGLQGVQGVQGPPGPTASSYGSVENFSSTALSGTFTKVVDLQTGTNGGLLKTTFIGRILATASVTLGNNDTSTSDSSCKLQIAPNGGAFTDMSQRMRVRIAAFSGTQDVVVSPVGAADEPAGTYNVRAVCSTGGSDTHWATANVIAWAAAK